MKAIEVVPVSKGKQEGEEYEAKGWGMTVKEIVRHENPAIAFFAKQGVFVFGAQWGGTARTAGLVERDVITELGGKKIDSMATFKSEFEALRKRNRGERKVVVRVLRAGFPMVMFVDFERDAEAEEKAEEEKNGEEKK